MKDETLNTKKAVLLVGKVTSIEPEGDLWRTNVTLTGPSNQTKDVVVLGTERLDQSYTQKNARVAILGAVVIEPSEKIGGYDGNEPWAIWLGRAVKLAAPSNPVSSD